MPRHISFQLHLTNECNLKCRHCYNQDNQSYLSRQQFYHILQEVLEFIRREDAIPGWICFSGGEPTLSPILIDCIQNAQRAGFNNVAVYSNGTNITSDFAEKLVANGCKYIQICIEGGKEIHNFIRCGTWNTVLESWEKCRNAGLKVNNQTTINNINYQDLNEIIRICRNRVDFTFLIKEVPLCKNTDVLLPSLWFKVLEQVYYDYYMTDKRNQSFIIVRDPVWSTLFYDTGYACPFNFREKVPIVTVECDGTVYPCRRAGVSIGNIFTKSLTTIYEDFRNSGQTPSKSDIDQLSWRSALGCRGFAKKLGDDLSGKDPYCRLEEYAKVESDGARTNLKSDSRSTVNLRGVEISVSEILKYWRIRNKAGGVLTELVAQNIAVKAARKRRIKVNNRELQHLADLFRKSSGLISASSMECWLESAGVSLESFENFLERSLFVDKLKDRLWRQQKSPTCSDREHVYQEWLKEKIASRP